MNISYEILFALSVKSQVSSLKCLHEFGVLFARYHYESRYDTRYDPDEIPDQWVRQVTADTPLIYACSDIRLLVAFHTAYHSITLN